ncbi:hypothetical protein [Psychrobacter sp. I-STPA10]|uniref:hypothetical protein n=1 Tax=Psychrobacter sp. I-STPA10 TaxID=2585769 RepID=UPI001E47C364|nr:hypothetical protein [Psychrobacter sp. I-STPA10]
MKSSTLYILTGISILMMSTHVLAQPLDESLSYSNTALNTQSSIQLIPKSVSPQKQIVWTINANAYSPTQPIASFVDDWDASLDKGDVAFAQGQVGISVTPANSQLSYGLDWRYDYLMTFNQPTAQVYWQYKNDVAADSHQTYPLYLQARHNERLGAHVGMNLPLADDWVLATKAHIWQGRHAIDGQFAGSMLTQPLSNQGSNKKSLRDSLEKANATLNYYYDQPALDEENLGWYPKSPHGYGYSLDVSLQGQLGNSTQLVIDGYDILGKMYWKDIPSTHYDLDYEDSRRPPYTLEGSLNTDAEVQRIPWRVETHLTHDLANQWQLGLHSQSNTYQHLYQLSAGYPLHYGHHKYTNTPIMLTGLLEPQSKAIGFAIDSPYAGIKLLTDSLKSNEAKRAQVSIYGQYQW